MSKLYDEEKDIEIENEELETPATEDTEEEVVEEVNEEIGEDTKKKKIRIPIMEETADEEFDRQKAQINTLLGKLEKLEERLANENLSPIKRFILTIKLSILETRIERALQNTKMRVHVNQWGERDEVARKQLKNYRDNYANVLEEVEKQQRVVEDIATEMMQKGVPNSEEQEIVTTKSDENRKKVVKPVKTENSKDDKKQSNSKENNTTEENDITKPIITKNDLENKLKEAQEKLKELEAKRDLKKAELEENEKEFEEYMEYADKETNKIVKKEYMSWWKGFKMAISKIFSNLKESRNSKKALKNALSEAGEAAKEKIKNGDNKAENLKEELNSIENERETFTKNLAAKVETLNEKYGIEPNENEEQKESADEVNTQKIIEETEKQIIMQDAEEAIKIDEENSEITPENSNVEPAVVEDEFNIEDYPELKEQDEENKEIYAKLEELKLDIEKKKREAQERLESGESERAEAEAKAKYEETLNKVRTEFGVKQEIEDDTETDWQKEFERALRNTDNGQKAAKYEEISKAKREAMKIMNQRVKEALERNNKPNTTNQNTKDEEER